MIFAHKSLQVLLADDDPGDHNKFREALLGSQQPVKIQSVYNGLKLIDYMDKIFTSNCTRPDLIITDLYMPFAGGLQVLKQIRRKLQCNDIPIYVFSANFDGTIQRNVNEFGATGFYQKPASFDHLQLIISEIVNRHPLVSGLKQA